MNHLECPSRCDIGANEPAWPKGNIDSDSYKKRERVQSIKVRLVCCKESAIALSKFDDTENGSNLSEGCQDMKVLVNVEEDARKSLYNLYLKHLPAQASYRTTEEPYPWTIHRGSVCESGG